MSIVVFPEDPTTKNKRLKFEERQAIAERLLKESKEGKPKYGSLKQAAICSTNQEELFYAFGSNVNHMLIMVHRWMCLRNL